MKHLSPEDVVDVMEGCARPDLVRHAETCEACRAMVDDAVTASGLVGKGEVPEPSPLFWTQFSARAADSVRQAPKSMRWWPDSMWSWRALPAGFIIVLVALVALTQWQSVRQPLPVATESAMAPLVDSVELLPAIPPDDEPWALVSQLMADLAADELAAAGMPATIGSADRALESLSDGETAELTRLLIAEIAAPAIVPE